MGTRIRRQLPQERLSRAFSSRCLFGRSFLFCVLFGPGHAPQNSLELWRFPRTLPWSVQGSYVFACSHLFASASPSSLEFWRFLRTLPWLEQGNYVFADLSR